MAHIKRIRWRAILVALLFGGMALLLSARSLVAFACPTCFGMTRLAEGLLIEQDAGDEVRRRMIAARSEAQRRLSAFYPHKLGKPDVIACSTWRCYQRFGGGAPQDGRVTPKGVAHGAYYIKLSPDGTSEELAAAILAHELAHIELHKRLGLIRTAWGLPVWFDEGLAVIISKDPRAKYGEKAFQALPLADRELPLDQLATLRTWRQSFRAGKPVYTIAAHHVRTWLRGAADPARHLEALIERLRRGEDFASALVAFR